MLQREAGPTRDAPSLAAAARRLGEGLVQQATPLIGKAGMAAISARALHLAEQRFPWLADIDKADRGAEMFVRLQMILEQHKPPVAVEAAVAVLATINDLLTSVIGVNLTTRLLHTAWPDSEAITSTWKRGLEP
jgi:hypothetical protein